MSSSSSCVFICIRIKKTKKKLFEMAGKGNLFLGSEGRWTQAAEVGVLAPSRIVLLCHAVPAVSLLLAASGGVPIGRSLTGCLLCTRWQAGAMSWTCRHCDIVIQEGTCDDRKCAVSARWCCFLNRYAQHRHLFTLTSLLSLYSL